MAVRDFKDESDVVWKAWPVLATSIHPRTAAEDYLGDFSEGWLCFECTSGDRRRLAKYPREWDKLSEEQLRSLLKAASPVAARKRTPPKASDSPNP
jgi:hypothetical protein